MRKTLIIVFAALGLAFLAVSWLRWRSAPGEGSEPEQDRSGREAVVSFWAAHQRATELRTRGDFPAAVESYREALRFDPGHEESLYYLSASLFELGQYREARQVSRRLLEVNPDSQRGQGQLGLLLGTPLPGVTIDPEGARKIFTRMAERNPEESGPFLRLGSLALLENRLPEALQHFQTAAGFRSPEGLLMAGYVRLLMGRHEEASSDFARVLEIEAREREISGRGVQSEGDVAEDAEEQRLTPLASAALKARVLLMWSSRRLGGYTKEIPESFRLPLTNPASLFERISAGELPARESQLGDLDGDGKADLILVGNSNQPLVFTDQQGRPGRMRVRWEPSPNFPAEDVALGDADGDGDLDVHLTLGYWRGGPVRLFLNEGMVEGSLHFREDLQLGIAGERTAGRVSFLHQTGGQIDLIELASDNPSLRLLRRRIDGTFAERSDAGLSFEGSAVDVTAGDLDGDGWLDLYVQRWKLPGVLFRNGGDGSFRDVTTESGLQTPGDSYSAALIDFDRDGRLDVFVSRVASYDSVMMDLSGRRSKPSSHAPRLYRNLGGMRFEALEPEESGLTSPFGTLRTAVADVNGDGWDDIVLANGSVNGNRLEPSVVLINLSGRFDEPRAVTLSGVPFRAVSVSAGDIDGDGRAEIVFPGTGVFRFRR